jgi:protein MpaA
VDSFNWRGGDVAAGALRWVAVVACACVGAECAARPDGHSITPRPVAGGESVSESAPELAPAAVVETDTSREVLLGTSTKGEPLKLYVFGGGAGAPAPGASFQTLVIAAIHGDEPSAAFVGRELVEYLRVHPEFTRETGAVVGVIPLANPDGVALRTRTNANGVDCNRNFPASNWRATRPGRNHTGPSPASEPETRAVMHAVETLRPARVVSIHSPLRCNNYDGPPAALALAQLMSRYNGYPVEASIGYATPGSFGTWAGVDRGIPVVTLELPPHTPGPRAWAENRDALLAVIEAP